MKKQTNIYIVEANEIARKTYKIQAITEDEALQIASKLWAKDKFENADKDPSIIKIKSKNSSPSKSDWEYVDNKTSI